jgi:glucuronate isomerase
MKPFLDRNFLLNSEPAEILYHTYAADMPIFDYHCHLPVDDIAADRKFENLTRIWLSGDHYKWRAMRADGVPEELVTGSASDRDKFRAWARTVPHTVCNPLYHWTHMELQRYFGITELLSPSTADAVYERSAEMLHTDEFSVRRLLARSNVRGLCTTDDPTDTLEHHLKLRESSDFPVRVLPTFRPDKAFNVSNPEELNGYLDLLGERAGIDIDSYGSFLEAIEKRHDYFHAAGCRLADHGMTVPLYLPASRMQLERAFSSVRSGRELSADQALMLAGAGLAETAKLHARRGWVMQLHIGALRNGNSRMFGSLGPDSGYDSIASNLIISPLQKLLDSLEQEQLLPKTIIYPLNPADYYPIATLLGSFPEEGVPGKMQFGSGWWFLDQKEGMEYQLKVLSSIGLLSRFVGMLTDSRSFLSYPRHEYFRRILCAFVGDSVERGEVPADYDLLGSMIRNICYNNSAAYVPVGLKPV